MLDQGLFALLFYRLAPALGLPPLIVSVLLARSVSLVFNYLVNRNIVFRQKGKYMDSKSFAGYLCLCFFIMASSYGLVKLSTLLFSDINVLITKIVVDAVLFLLSYKLQNKVIFREKRND